MQLLDTLVQALTGDGARGLDVPVVARAERFEAEKCLDLGHVQGAREVLLVGQHEDGDVARVLADLEQLEFGLLQSVLFGGVDDEDDAVGAASVRPPKRPQLFLTSDVPNEK